MHYKGVSEILGVLFMIIVVAIFIIASMWLVGRIESSIQELQSSEEKEILSAYSGKYVIIPTNSSFKLINNIGYINFSISKPLKLDLQNVKCTVIKRDDSSYSSTLLKCEININRNNVYQGIDVIFEKPTNLDLNNSILLIDFITYSGVAYKVCINYYRPKVYALAIPPLNFTKEGETNVINLTVYVINNSTCWMYANVSIDIYVDDRYTKSTGAIPKYTVIPPGNEAVFVNYTILSTPAVVDFYINVTLGNGVKYDHVAKARTILYRSST